MEEILNTKYSSDKIIIGFLATFPLHIIPFQLNPTLPTLPAFYSVNPFTVLPPTT